jgi:hypothetical protein
MVHQIIIGSRKIKIENKRKITHLSNDCRSGLGFVPHNFVCGYKQSNSKIFENSFSINLGALITLYGNLN